LRNVGAERARCVEIDHQLERGRLHDRKAGGLVVFKNLAGVDAGLSVDRRDIRTELNEAGVTIFRSSRCSQWSTNLPHANINGAYQLVALVGGQAFRELYLRSIVRLWVTMTAASVFRRGSHGRENRPSRQGAIWCSWPR
jgi:hypothetical protein